MREGKREREREEVSKREKEGCALTVGIHERSPPGGLACERTLCSSLSTPCLPPSFSFSPLAYRLIFFTGPEVGGPPVYSAVGCLSPVYPPCKTKHGKHGTRGKSVIWENSEKFPGL